MIKKVFSSKEQKLCQMGPDNDPCGCKGTTFAKEEGHYAVSHKRC